MITRSTADICRKIFLRASILFGLFLGVFAGWVGGIWLGLVAGIGGGLYYGLVMALAVGAYHQFSIKRLKTNYEETLLGVHQVQVLIVKQAFDEAFETCVSSALVLRKCQITQQDKESGIIRVQTGATGDSFGEKIMLMVSSTDVDTCRVTISSKPLLGGVLVDGGKNVKNLRSIVDALSKRTAIVDTLPGSDNTAKCISQDETTDQASDAGITINVKTKQVLTTHSTLFQRAATDSDTNDGCKTDE